MKIVDLGMSNYAVMIGYLVGVVLIGLWFSRKERSSEEYLLGGRRLPWLAVGISCLMSGLSTYSLVMVPGEIYNNGISLYMLGFLGPPLLILFFFIFMRFYFRLGSFTPFEYLQRRYDSRVRFLIAMIFLWLRLIYLGMVLFTSAKVFEGAAGWPAWFTILLVGIIGIVYTVLGGMKAVVWTDVMQFVVMFIGLGTVVYICCERIDGGAMGILRYAFDHGRGPVKFVEPSFYRFSPYTRLCFWLMLLGLIQNEIFTTCADQIYIQRLLSTSNYRNGLKAAITSSIFTIPSLLMLYFIGFAIFSFYSQNPDPRVTSGDTAFFTFIGTQLPPPLPGLILSAMLAAAMSTLDSGMNSLSAIWVKEFYQLHIKKDVTETEQVTISRIATVFFGAFSIGLGILIAMTSDTLGQTVVEAATAFWAFGVVILPAYLFAVLSQRAQSKMIWVLALFCWGINFGGNTWYLCTKSATSSLRGPMPVWITLLPLCFGLLGLLTGHILKKRRNKIRTGCIFTSLLITGYGVGTGMWYLMSNFSHGGEQNYSLSFQWVGLPGFITFMLIGTIWLIFFGKNQPKDKYMGLTLWTAREEISK